MTTAEKLAMVAENVPKVYEAGFEAGKAEGGEVEFDNVSLVELNEQGKITFSNPDDDMPPTVAEGRIDDDFNTVIVSISGYIEMSGKANGWNDITISVDGNVVYTYTGDYTDQPFEYKGNVNESIAFKCDMGGFYFDRFVIRKDYDKGYVDGKQWEYDRFWDNYQENGNKTNYNYAFSGSSWNSEIFCPKYPLSGMSYANSMFQGAHRLTDIPYTIDLTGLNAVASSVFQGATALRTIKEIVVKESNTYSTCFNSCTALEEVRFTGTIGENGLNFQWSTKLTTASLLSVLKALSKDSSVASGKSITFASVSESVINTDSECVEQLTLAKNAGWEIKFV